MIELKTYNKVKFYNAEWIIKVRRVTRLFECKKTYNYNLQKQNPVERAQFNVTKFN